VVFAAVCRKNIRAGPGGAPSIRARCRTDGALFISDDRRAHLARHYIGDPGSSALSRASPAVEAKHRRTFFLPEGINQMPA